jgi:hypothetical protein
MLPSGLVCFLFSVSSLSSFVTLRQRFPRHCIWKDHQLILIMTFSQGSSIKKSQHDAQSNAFWWSSQRQFTGTFRGKVAFTKKTWNVLSLIYKFNFTGCFGREQHEFFTQKPIFVITKSTGSFVRLPSSPTSDARWDVESRSKTCQDGSSRWGTQ